MGRPGHSWRAFRELSCGQRWLLVQAWLTLPIVAAGLRLIGFRMMRTLLLLGDGATAGRTDLAAAHSLARIVRGAANWTPFHANCLARSLVLSRLLRCQGLAHNLRIGVHKPDGHFAAHAWVEHGCVALAEPETVADRYATFENGLLSKRV